MASGLFLLRGLGDEGLGGQEQARDRRSVLKGQACDFDGVDDARFEQVAPFAGLGIVAVMGIIALFDVADDDSAVDSSVLGDEQGRLFDGAADDFRAQSSRRR